MTLPRQHARHRAPTEPGTTPPKDDEIGVLVESLRGGDPDSRAAALHDLWVVADAQPHLRPAIEAALAAAAGEGVDVTVGRLSTLVRGDEPAVFAALRAAFDAAGSSGSTVMVATLADGAPADETIAGIQHTVRDDDRGGD